MSGTECCGTCGKPLDKSNRDRGMCRDCLSPTGKVADLEIAIVCEDRYGSENDNPKRIREWPVIRHLLRKRFGQELSNGQLWERCTDWLQAEGMLAPQVYLAFSYAQLVQILQLGLSETWQNGKDFDQLPGGPLPPNVRACEPPELEDLRKWLALDGIKGYWHSRLNNAEEWHITVDGLHKSIAFLIGQIFRKDPSEVEIWDYLFKEHGKLPSDSIDLLAFEHFLREDAAARVGKRQQPKPDGIYEDELCIVWGGVTFNQLTDKMIGLLRILHDAYIASPVDGLKAALIYERAGMFQPDSSFRNQFRNKRDGKLIPHKVLEIIEKLDGNCYRLIDPKSTRKVPTSTQ